MIALTRRGAAANRKWRTIGALKRARAKVRESMIMTPTAHTYEEMLNAYAMYERYFALRDIAIVPQIP